jgi:hypothetical protein
MRFEKIGAALAAFFVVFLAAGDFAEAGGRGGRVRNANTEGGGGANIDLAVRQVTVAPVRAHVGDVVRVEVVIENKAEGYDTVSAEVRANGKVVARKLFTYGMSPAERIYRESFLWDTRNAAPGDYRISAEVFVWEDSSPFDNSLDVKQPLRLVSPGAPFPGGDQAGGSATEKDPRFSASSSGGSGPAGETGAGGGY